MRPRRRVLLALLAILAGLAATTGTTTGTGPDDPVCQAYSPDTGQTGCPGGPPAPGPPAAEPPPGTGPPEPGQAVQEHFASIVRAELRGRTAIVRGTVAPPGIALTIRIQDARDAELAVAPAQVAGDRFARRLELARTPRPARVQVLDARGVVIAARPLRRRAKRSRTCP